MKIFTRLIQIRAWDQFTIMEEPVSAVNLMEGQQQHVLNG
jgi:hypothetical protein